MSTHSSASSIASAGSASKIQLKRELGLINGVTIVVGSIIGSGIFVSPKGVIEACSGSVAVSLIIWVVGGLISLIGAICYAELGTTIIRSGGDYAYIKEAFGNLPAFLQLWVNLVIIRPTAQAIVALTFANYALQPFYFGCQPPSIAVQLLAFSAIALLTWVNVMKVRWAMRIQDLFTVAKLLALLVIIVTGFVMLGLGHVENFENIFDSTSPITAPGISIALYSSLFSYAGWNFLNVVTDELKNPYVNLPRAIYISVPLVTIVYTLTNVAYLVVLTPYEIVASNAVAVTFAERLYSYMAWIMPVFVSLSCFGGVNGMLFTSGRLNFVGAEEGQLPQLFAMIHAHRLTPVPAMLITAALSIIMLIVPDVFALINYFSFVQWISVGASVFGMVWMRYTRPEMPRPIRLNMAIPFTFLVFVVFLIVVPAIEKPMEFVFSMVIIFSGIPVYLVGVAWDPKPKAFTDFYEKTIRKCQQIMYVVKQE